MTAAATTTIALEDSGAGLAELAARVENGETIVVTRNGRPVLDLVPHPHQRKGGFDYEAAEAYIRSAGIERWEGFIADDFDDPLPEDFLITPLPEP